VRAAIRFLRANAATYALDPARFGAWGSAAGGHLVALAGTSGNDPALEGTIGGHLRHSSRLQAVVDYYGPTDLLNMGLDQAPAPGRPARHDLPTSPESLLVGFSAADEGLGVLRANEANPLAPYPDWRTLAVQANPITWVDAVDPPFLIAHGAADGTVPPRQSEHLRDALRAAGASPVHVAVDGAGHGGFPAAVQQQAQDFLVARLTAPVIAIGEPRGLTGAWYDPAQSGQGFEFLWLDGGRFVVTFCGHRDDGGNLVPIGTREGAPAYGEDLRIDLVATRGGRFNGFDAARIRREPWGALALRIDACDRATATLDGADGRQSFALAKLAGGPGPACDGTAVRGRRAHRDDASSGELGVARLDAGAGDHPARAAPPRAGGGRSGPQARGTKAGEGNCTSAPLSVSALTCIAMASRPPMACAFTPGGRRIDKLPAETFLVIPPMESDSMRKSLLATALAAALGTALGSASSSATAQSGGSTVRAAFETHIVLFEEPGLLYNAGQVPGRAATAPSATGTRKLDASTPAAQAYRAFLRERQDAYLRSIEAALARPLEASYRYEVTDNGIALALSTAEAAKVEALPGVKSVRPAGTYELSGDGQSTFIGATQIWSGVSVPAGTPASVRRGQGIKVGIVDSGINISHPSYAAMGASCDFATSTPKLLLSRNCIGDSTCAAGASGQDLNGHGSHVAATAAGNPVAAGSAGANLPAVDVSGVAPCAQVIAYRVCEQSSCDGSAIFAAFQAVIADQVDVVNFSISGGTNPWVDNDRLKLDAVNADVFVAASAGNTGTAFPNPVGTVNHRGPWVMSVGNSTDDRPNQGANSAIRLQVASPTPPEGPLAGNIQAYGMGSPLNPATNTEIRFSTTNPLGCTANGGYPAGFFANSLALIQRGTCTFEEKLNNAQAAGALGGIIFNNVAGVPAFSPGAATLRAAALEQAVGEALRNFINTNAVANPAVATRVNTLVSSRLGGVLNASSLRGPNASFDVTKPDITGPGTNIYDAFVAPQLFAFLTGTSMSGPHVAGGAALVRAVRPTWTPMEVHSALMMTARRDQWMPDVVTPATPDDVGTGMIDLSKAALAGFVMNETGARFTAANPASGGNPRTLNVASMRNTNCVDRCEFNRTIRNTVTAATSWTATITAPSGFTIRPIAPFGFGGTTTETHALRVVVDMPEGTTLTNTQFAEIRFDEVNSLSPPLVWTVAIRGSGSAGLADVLLKDGFETLE